MTDTTRTPIPAHELIDSINLSACDYHDGSDGNRGLRYNPTTGILTVTFERASDQLSDPDHGDAEYRFQLLPGAAPGPVLQTFPFTDADGGQRHLIADTRVMLTVERPADDAEARAIPDVASADRAAVRGMTVRARRLGHPG